MHHQIHAQGATQPHPQEDIHRRRGGGSIEIVRLVKVRVRVRVSVRVRLVPLGGRATKEVGRLYSRARYPLARALMMGATQPLACPLSPSLL